MLFNRQQTQTPHEKWWRGVHPAIKAFFIGNPNKWVNQTRNLPTAGAEAFAYSQQMLPILEWKGPGEVVLRQVRATAPQVFQLQQVVPTGIPGIGAGQIWNGGLIDNPGAADTLAGEIV